MRFSMTMLAVLTLPLFGCGQQMAPSVSVEAGESAKQKVLKMNDEHQKKLEQLTLPGQE